MNRNFPRFLGAPALGLTLLGIVFLMPQVRAETSPSNFSPTSSVNKMGSSGATRMAPANDLKNGISGNVPLASSGQNSGAMPQDNTHGVTSPGRLIGPAPENGQPDPRFIGENNRGGSNQINSQTASAGSVAPPYNDDSTKNQGTSTSNINEGLPSASQDNSGGNSGGSGSARTQAGGNAGGDARPGAGAAQSGGASSNVGGEIAGAAPYAIAGIGVAIVAFLGTMIWARAKKKS